MPIELKMPALSPTMEEGTLAKWLVKAGDMVKSGDILAEIETDKATMEYEAIDEGMIAQIVVPEGSEGVKVGAVIALLTEEGESSSPPPSGEGGAPRGDAGGEGDDAVSPDRPHPSAAEPPAPSPDGRGSGEAERPRAKPVRTDDGGDRIKASPLARRLAGQQGIDLARLNGSGPNGRIVKADLDGAKPGGAEAKALPGGAEAKAQTKPVPAAKAPKPASVVADGDTPHEAIKLSNMRRTIARRLTESKQTVPHIYLTVDVNLDRLLKLRGELNEGLAGRGIKLSVNDLLIKALAVALEQVPACNVQFAGDQLLMFRRADISVAVSIPGGLITPIVVDAGAKPVSRIATEMKDLAGRAREGKLQPMEYQGGTASLSNMGMYGIKQFEAVINPPQGMILAIGAGEKRPAVIKDSLQIATVMSATGSFDHRAIDGADGALLMKAFRELVEAPLGMLA